MIGAVVWGAASLLVLSEYRRIDEQTHLNELWLLLSLLWIQFGFAGVFSDLRRHRGRHLKGLLLITLLPPLILHFLVFFTA